MIQGQDGVGLGRINLFQRQYSFTSALQQCLFLGKLKVLLVREMSLDGIPRAAVFLPQLSPWWQCGEYFFQFHSSLCKPTVVSGGKACKRLQPFYDYSPQVIHILILVHTHPIAICETFWLKVPPGLNDSRQLLPQLSKC